jgi:hypothetical protein
MVHRKVIDQQLHEIRFGASIWNQAEIKELPNIIHEGEKISECVNGFYEGGVALLVATEMRVLLVDKKPLNFLNVEDLRFDMINEIDYNHRLTGATITISTGSKTLRFRSYNQGRLRNLINLVQERMSLIKKEQTTKADTQQQHLEEINKQLRLYLMAQREQLQRLAAGEQQDTIEPLKPSPELSDYLLAQQLLERFDQQRDIGEAAPLAAVVPAAPPAETPATPEEASMQTNTNAAPAAVEPAAPPVDTTELLTDARREIFGDQQPKPAPEAPSPQPPADGKTGYAGLEINPLRIAYSKLPMMLRNRKFGRPYITPPPRAAAPSR